MRTAPRREAAYRNFNPKGKACWRCGSPASQRDHRPPLALHVHRAGSGCCVIMAVCYRCNLREGQAISLAMSVARGTKRRSSGQRSGVLAVQPPSVF